MQKFGRNRTKAINFNSRLCHELQLMYHRVPCGIFQHSQTFEAMLELRLFHKPLSLQSRHDPLDQVCRDTEMYTSSPKILCVRAVHWTTIPCLHQHCSPHGSTFLSRTLQHIAIATQNCYIHATPFIVLIYMSFISRQQHHRSHMHA